MCWKRAPEFVLYPYVFVAGPNKHVCSCRTRQRGGHWVIERAWDGDGVVLGDRNNVSTTIRTLRLSTHLFWGVLDVSLGEHYSHRGSRWIVGCKRCRNGEVGVILVGI